MITVFSYISFLFAMLVLGATLFLGLIKIKLI